MNIENLLKIRKTVIDKKLNEILPKENAYPEKLHKAMRYSVFSGGKRIRPILAIESCLCCGGNITDVIEPACAIELVHTFSLIHDDLPAMDNDDYRRGKPTCHKKFDEATATLAGDALLSLAFEGLSKADNTKVGMALVKELSHSIGSFGMAGGQAIDIEYEGKKKDIKTLNYINSHKTGVFIKAALKMGAIAAGASSKKINKIERFGILIGEVFQIVDDILDNANYAIMCGRAAAYKNAKFLTQKAKDSLKDFGNSAQNLKTIADYLIERKI